jgi:hypothetical protein
VIRVLIVGRDSDAWARSLGQRAGGGFELDTAAMPAAGMRQFEATPPDALVVVESGSARRAATLVRAIRERPMGQLIPILVVAPAPGDEHGDMVDAWLAQDSGVEPLFEALRENLGLESGPSPAGFVDQRTPAVPTMPQPPASSPPFNPANNPQSYYIEEIEDDWDRPRQLRHESIFPSSGSRLHDLGAPSGGLDAAAIQKKLQAVRHQDYYAILEIRHGAEATVVREAYHRLYRQFDPNEIDFSLVHRFEAEIAEIRDALEDAWAVLGDPKLREAYLARAIRG